ncbi:hypothetical protein [Pseudogemmobacter bohemicus]|uniref:hypothetical protein n=1 Tax=Pseudogemmobacter bohemicus TaxID=2250708 RepID=UPI000DD2BD79|nr:hypothetical protein [Pseudogemmobacter bohemicus]
MTDLTNLLPKLPAQDLTEEQAWGFRLACSMMVTVGRQLESAPSLAGTPPYLQSSGGMMASMAAGLAVTIGCPD